MKTPKFPCDFDFDIPDRHDVVTLKLASIAQMEQSLAKLLRTETEILQSTITEFKHDKICFDDLKEANRKAERVLRAIISKEILLLFQLEDTIDFLL